MNSRFAAAMMGSVCALVTIIVLFGHIRSIDDLSLNHLFIVLGLTVAVGSAHFSTVSTSTPMRWCFALLFMIGTLVCVVMSGSRSAEIMHHREEVASQYATQRATQVAEIERANASVVSQKALYDKSRAISDDAKRDAADECKSGKGTKCDGKRATMQTAIDDETRAHNDYSEAVQYLREQRRILSTIPTPPTPNGDLKFFAHVMATITMSDEDRWFSVLMLVVPYFMSMLSEFGTICFFNYAFSHRPTPPRQGLTTISDIAKDLGIDVRNARKIARQLNIKRAAEGWAWRHDEAKIIRARIEQRVSTIN